MVVASNTSPISNLTIIARDPSGFERWLDQVAGASRRAGRATARSHLDPGEAEAIALVLELSAGLILLDEKDGRSMADRAGLRVTGLLGVSCGPSKTVRSNW
jgi:predicted nucleic acid-binding protein